MRCPSCHHDNRSDRRFCTQCGTKLAVGSARVADGGVGRQAQAVVVRSRARASEGSCIPTAIAIMREMEMGSWLEQAEAELKELG